MMLPLGQKMSLTTMKKSCSYPLPTIFLEPRAAPLHYLSHDTGMTLDPPCCHDFWQTGLIFTTGSHMAQDVLHSTIRVESCHLWYMIPSSLSD